MIQRHDLPTQAEIDRGIARARQLRAQAFTAAFARLAGLVRAGFARLQPDTAWRGRPA